MIPERDDRMIFLKDLLFTTLYQWRKILVAIVVFALVLGGYAAYKESAKVSDVPSKTVQEHALTLYKENKALLEAKIKHTKESLDGQHQYITQSPFMQLNATDLYLADVMFSIETDYQILPEMTYQNPDKTPAILQSYITFLTGDEVTNTAGQIIGVPAQYTSELISVSTPASTTLRIQIQYTTREGAQAIMDAIVNCLNQKQTQVAQSAGTHKLQLVTSSVTNIADPNVTTVQEAAFSRQEALRVNLANLELQLTQLQEPSSYVFSIKNVIVYAVVGAILGAFLIAGLACVCHIAGAKVYSERTLKNRTGIKVLGCIPSGKKMHPIDRFLFKLEGRCTSSDQIPIIAATVRTYCNNATSLLIAGDWDNTLQQSMVQALNALGIRSAVYSSLLDSPEALLALPNYESVLLIVQCGSSRYTHIEHEMEIATDHSKLIGCVLIDG